ncbi:MAG: hypothetical protein KF745_09505 [Phycisphaeraceae bacterium]|nr:hypothetical protein [Phycisphaeraceae bacterium]
MDRPATSRTPRIGASIQRPLVTLLLLAALAGLSWRALGRIDDRGAAGPGVIGTVLRQMPEIPGPLRYPDMYALRDGNGTVRLIDPESESMGEVSTIWEREPERVMTVSIEVGVGRTGFWGLTSEQRRVVVDVLPFVPEATTESELQSARRQGAARLPELARVWLDKSQWRRLAERAAAHDIDERRIVWSGWLFNAATIVALGLLVYSLGWVPQAWARLLSVRGRRRESQGRCPTCGYDLTGVEEAICPECGSTIVAKTNAALVSGPRRRRSRKSM